VIDTPDVRLRAPRDLSVRTGAGPGIRARLRRPTFCWPIAVFAAGFGAAYLRNPTTFTRPELWAEDGAVWFSGAYNHGWVSQLVVTHTGYLQTLPRLVAGIGLLVPLVRLPLLFAMAAVAIQSLPAALLVSDRLAELIPNRLWRIGLAVLCLLAPNSAEVNANLTNAQWHLALVAVLVCVAARPRGAWIAFDVVVLVISGLTGPFALALVPVVAVLAYSRRTRWSQIVCGLVAVLAVIQGVELLTSPRGIYAPLGITWSRFVEIAGGQIVGGTMLGRFTVDSLQASSAFEPVSVVLLIAAVVLAVAACVYGPVELLLVNIFAVLVLAGSVLAPVASTHGSQWAVLAMHGGLRYWYLPSLVLLADVAILAVRARHLVARGLGLAALICAGAMAIREDFNYQAFDTVQWVAQVRRFDLARIGEVVRLRIEPWRGHWYMVLTKH
jgi:hypothetical protein